MCILYFAMSTVCLMCILDLDLWCYVVTVTLPSSAKYLRLCAFLQMDHLTGMSNLSLGGTTTSHTQSMQSFQTSLTSALSNPLSPAKAFPPLPNPNPSTPFGGINISSQLPAMDSGTIWFFFSILHKCSYLVRKSNITISVFVAVVDKTSEKLVLVAIKGCK